MKNIEEITDENNNENKSLVDDLDSEPGYFNLVIRPMLAPGHETELTYFFKSTGLIPHTQICSNAKLNEECNKSMEWVPAKVVDYYQWKCKNCSQKKSIRENSVFNDVKCNFKNSIRILLGWCKGYDIETMASMLGVKKHVVKSLYSVVAITARQSLRSHPPSRQLGGPGVVVIVDTYPEGCTNYTRPMRGNRPILCIAEAKDIPPRYWFEALDRFSRTNTDQIASVKEHVMRIVQEVVLPGSIIVTRSDATLCSYYDFQILRDLYSTIVSVESLARHDNDRYTIGGNLETVWKIALDICEQAQFFSFNEVPIFLMSQIWQSRFGNEGFEILLNQLTDMQ